LTKRYPTNKNEVLIFKRFKPFKNNNKRGLKLNFRKNLTVGNYYD